MFYFEFYDINTLIVDVGSRMDWMPLTLFNLSDQIDQINTLITNSLKLILARGEERFWWHNCRENVCIVCESKWKYF